MITDFGTEQIQAFIPNIESNGKGEKIQLRDRIDFNETKPVSKTGLECGLTGWTGNVGLGCQKLFCDLDLKVLKIFLFLSIFDSPGDRMALRFLKSYQTYAVLTTHPISK
jgi:hypothetical protein